MAISQWRWQKLYFSPVNLTLELVMPLVFPKSENSNILVREVCAKDTADSETEEAVMIWAT